MCLAQKEIDRVRDGNGWADWITRKAAEAHCARNRAAYRSGEANGYTYITPYEMPDWELIYNLAGRSVANNTAAEYNSGLQTIKTQENTK
jgi:hypothetical protein